ncbi:hypothetical protein [Streptomyces sp. NPDC006333]|uniref:hypothetical protein n=1 Tax=Streptomyces sp. NPDC006333 TaxID=3156753 RepID=UPI0033A6FEFE
MNESPRPETGQSNPSGQQPGSGFSHMPPPPNFPPQPQMTPSFGYMQQPGYVNAPLDMPQRVKAARIVLFLLAGFLIILGLAALVQAEAAQSALSDPFSPYSGSSGPLGSAMYEAKRDAAAQTDAARFGMVGSAIYAVIAIVLALRFGKGGNALRIGTIVYGAWHCIMGTFALGLTASSAPAATVMAALVQLAAGVVLIVFMAQRDGVAWFSRTRH